MHSQYAETMAHHCLLEGGTGLLEGFRRVENEERIHGWFHGVPYQLRYHWVVCSISWLWAFSDHSAQDIHPNHGPRKARRTRKPLTQPDLWIAGTEGDLEDPQ